MSWGQILHRHGSLPEDRRRRDVCGRGPPANLCGQAGTTWGGEGQVLTQPQMVWEGLGSLGTHSRVSKVFS